MAAGTAVVAIAVAGNVEIVRHRETGLLGPRREPLALAAALDEALSDPAASLARAAVAREFVWTNLTTHARAERMEEHYSKWRRKV